ncbi:cation diffusion facilitator family transporter [Halobacillus salinarum]|uniref:Cation diffusion facilitator family transporter n=1 Tax=Halobacillus salinarum TaxID=2932257 RepID=A0ABY4ENV2_9BACI|nr:cation diffusion facilitator family transporter [Halobacillus salinarum]UOQ45665.1 cation diffusion facilitator family transporter [Halobacillus salinarum]
MSSHVHKGNERALLINFILITAFMIAEFIGGWLINSLALLSDAGHMLSDTFSLGLSFLAIVSAKKTSTAEKSFGYKRFEILAALFNGILLIVISIYIVWEAWKRFFDPPEVAGYGMLGIAALGLIINLAAAWILYSKGDTNENLNLRSAFLHVLSDLLGSVGAIAAALFILFLGWNLADPIVSVFVSILILVSGFRVLKDTIHVLMEGTPVDISLDEVKSRLLSIPQVIDVHDLHVWTITSGYPSLSSHLIVQVESDRDEILIKAFALLKEHFAIEHITLQLEGEGLKLNELHLHDF